MNGAEGWYVHSFEPAKDQTRSFRLDRIRSVTVLDEVYEPREGVEPEMQGWPTTGEVPASQTARVWISPERARWAREDRRVTEELADGSVVVELPFGGHEYLAREVLKEAGDAAVLEPEDGREAVLAAAEELLGVTKRLRPAGAQEPPAATTHRYFALQAFPTSARWPRSTVTCLVDWTLPLGLTQESVQLSVGP